LSPFAARPDNNNKNAGDDVLRLHASNNNWLLDLGNNLLGQQSSSKVEQARRQSLLRDLRAACAAATPKQQRRPQVEALIDQLAPLSPITATAVAPQLQRRWRVLWTTEKEINWFLEAGLSTDIYQTILRSGDELENCIPLGKNGKNGSFTVTGLLRVPDPNGVRTEFAFDTATFRLGSWLRLAVPPVGKGWFDTLYLDNDGLRVDRNSRNDILICEAVEDE